MAAGTPLIYITTDNESRTESLVTRAVLQGIKGMPVPHEWNCAAGFPGQEGTVDPLTASALGGRAGRARHLHLQGHALVLAGNPYIQRTLKDFAAVRRPPGKTLVFIGAEPDIPPPLREDFPPARSLAFPTRERSAPGSKRSRKRISFCVKICSGGEGALIS